MGPVNFEAQTDCAESQSATTSSPSRLLIWEKPKSRCWGPSPSSNRRLIPVFRMRSHVSNSSFAANFKSFFGGGEAELADHGNRSARRWRGHRRSGAGSSVDQPDRAFGRRRALTATALLFALLEANQRRSACWTKLTPRSTEANVARFTRALQRSWRKDPVHHHHAQPWEHRDSGTIYGLSIGEDQSSKVLSSVWPTCRPAATTNVASESSVTEPPTPTRDPFRPETLEERQVVHEKTEQALARTRRSFSATSGESSSGRRSTKRCGGTRKRL